MIRSFKTHAAILPPVQQRLWAELSPTAGLGMVLYRGTAIALRIGHRFSVDFDFFTDRPLDKKEIRDALSFLSGSLIIQDSLDTLSVLVTLGQESLQSVKVSFFGSIGFGRVGEPELTEDGVLQVASLDDLMATKVKVILQRIEAKDHRDIIAALTKGGFEVIRIKGSHHYVRHPDGRSTVIPVHAGETIGSGLMIKILKDCELSREDLQRLL